MTMESAEIERRISEFDRWHYEFDLQGHKTPIWYPAHVNRHEQRARYFFEPLVRCFGGSLRGKRVLDLGCNAGFWSLKAIEAGCDFVLGVDARPENIEQARFVFEATGVPAARFDLKTADVFDFDHTRYGTFDIVLNLGLLYHVSRPIELLQASAQANSDVLVLDTAISAQTGPYFELRFESTELPVNAVGNNMVIYPTAEAIFAVTRALGYQAVMLKPDLTDPIGCWDYEHAKRRAFLCAKGRSLSGLSAEGTDELETLQREERR